MDESPGWTRVFLIESVRLVENLDLQLLENGLMRMDPQEECPKDRKIFVSYDTCESHN